MLSPRSNFFARALLGLIAACTAGAAAPPAVTAKPPGLAPPQPSPQPAATTTAAPPAAAAAPAPDMLAAPMSGTEVIDMLDQTVDWYRTLATQQQFSTEPSDLLILYENRQLASQVTALAFDMARVDAKLLPKDASAPQSGATASSSQSLAQLQSKIDAQAASVQSEMDADRQKLAASPKKARQQLQAKIAELQGETDLLNTKKGIIASIAGVVNGGASGGSATNALRAQIDAMATALPASTGVAGSRRYGGHHHCRRPGCCLGRSCAGRALGRRRLALRNLGRCGECVQAVRENERPRRRRPAYGGAAGYLRAGSRESRRADARLVGTR